MSAKEFVKWLLENKHFDDDWFFENWIETHLREYLEKIQGPARRGIMRELLEKQLALCESGVSAKKCLTSECKFMDDPYSCQIDKFIRFVVSTKQRGDVNG